MREIYKRIDGNQYRQIHIVGDLHGCFNLLQSQLNEIGFNRQQDLLISVGDLIDRGQQNIECLELTEQPWFECVQGNHEQMALYALSDMDSNGALWFQNGGNWFWLLDSDQKMRATQLIDDCAQLPLVIELQIDGKKIVICHADYPSDKYAFGKRVDQESVVWSRDRFGRIGDESDETILGANAFFFGHTPIQRSFSPFNLNYIDTGAVFGGLLTIVRVK